MMKITFIRPNMTTARSSDAMEPLVFAVLRGLTPPDDHCVLYDERLEAIPTCDRPDLVAISVETITARRSYQIAHQYLRRGIPVVLGGYHPTLCPHEAARYATSIVVGDAEGCWPDVVEDARRGRLRRVYENRFPDLGHVPRDRSIFAGKRYRAVGLVEFGRGCRYCCDFCSVHAFYGKNQRRRPVSEVIQEIKDIGRRHIFFTDDNLLNDKDSFRELLTELEPLRTHWSCQISLDVAADEQLLQRMARSGCTSVTIGFESLLSGNLRQMRKLWNLQCGAYEELVRAIHKYGIMIYGGFVLGYDEDTVDSFRLTYDFAVRNKLFLANFNPLTPTPGTAIYERLKQSGRLIDDPWWLNPDYRYGQTTFSPARMTPEQLSTGCYWARTHFNSPGSILRRSLQFRANLRTPYNAAIFLAANLTSRREIRSKQGRHLGGRTELTPAFAAS